MFQRSNKLNENNVRIYYKASEQQKENSLKLNFLGSNISGKYKLECGSIILNIRNKRGDVKRVHIQVTDLN